MTGAVRHDPGSRLTRIERRAHRAEGVLEHAEEHYSLIEDRWTASLSHEDMTQREYDRRLRAERRAGGELGVAYDTLSRARKWVKVYKLVRKQYNRRYYDDRQIGTGG